MAIALVMLSALVLVMLAVDRSLEKSDTFKVLAGQIVTGGLIGGAVAFYYSANKTSKAQSETISSMAAANASLVANAPSQNGGSHPLP